MRPLSVGLAFTLFCFACSDHQPAVRQQPTVPDVNEARENLPTEVFSGHAVLGHEVRTFQVCGDDRVYWIRAEPVILEELRDLSISLTAEPYEPIFIEIEGRLSSERGDGFAADYDGLVFITAIRRISASSDSDC